MKTLYEILEVSEEASPEVITKVYRLLVKKYHPDVQKNGDNIESELKIKEINEAYDVLSDIIKRTEYDEKLQNDREQQKELEIEQLREELIKENYTNSNTNNKENNREEVVYENSPMENEEAYQKVEYEEPVQYEEKNRNEYSSIKHLWVRIKVIFIIIVIIFIIFILLWLIPISHQKLIELYENNIFVKIIVHI